jgi:hypothetical protein
VDAVSGIVVNRFIDTTAPPPASHYIPDQLSEPITGLVIYPFIAQLVRDTDITNGDETKTGYYAGVIVGHKKSTTLLTQFFFLASGINFLSGTMFDCLPVGVLVRQSLAVDLSSYLDRWVCRYLCYCLGYRNHSGPLPSFVASKVFLMVTLVCQFAN